MNKKTVALLMACVLLVGAAIGGTMAWLVDDTDPVTNVFTVGDINIKLEEHDYITYEDAKADNSLTAGTLNMDKLVSTQDNKNAYTYVPGDVLPKDPFVSVKKGSEDCYLFVKVVVDNNSCEDAEENEANPILTWTIDSIWTEYTPTNVVEGTKYYYCNVTKAELDELDPDVEYKDFNILANKQVSVSEEVTKGMVEILNVSDESKPSLTFTAAAVQSKNINGVDAAFAQTPFANN